MNINIYIENDLGQQLQEMSATLGRTRNALIREAISEWLEGHKTHEWPSCIQNFKGMEDAPRFESYRSELKKQKGDLFK